MNENSDPYFDMPDAHGARGRRTLNVKPPTTVAVWCVVGQHHWIRSRGTDENWWTARTETCEAHQLKAREAA